MVEHEARAGARLRWLPPRLWRVRTKVVAVVLVPLVLASILAGVNVWNQLAERNALAQVAEGTQLTGTVTALIDQLQVERNQTTAFVASGRRSDRAPLAFTTDRVDEAVVALRDAAPTVADLDPGVRGRYDVAMVRLGGLEALRNTALVTRFPAGSVADGYTSLVEPLLALSRDIAGAAGQTSVVRPATSLEALGRAKEQAEIQHTLLLLGASAGSLSAEDSEALRSAAAEQAAATAEFEAGSTPAQVQDFDDTVTGLEVDQRTRILQSALLRDAANLPLDVDAVAWDRAASVTAGSLRAVEADRLTELKGTADQLVTRASTAAAVAVLLVVLGVLIAIILAVFIAGSLISSLRRLRFAALDVAERRLPESIHRLESGEITDVTEASDKTASTELEPFPSNAEEEVGEVARAFDTVRREAVRLAGEQAQLRTNLNALFVNLSRRSQSLVERQLLLIDTLEGREEDPDVLADLFQLDHLATRMRRNSENLLVLGGSNPARGATDPVSVADLLRAAAGEVESYQRIEIRPTPGVHLLGGPADDLTHLVAELLDNATTFSAPDTAVVVNASRAPDGGLIIEITDEGLGMDADDLAETNTRLERPLLLDSSVPRQMGLFVVGALARRHEIVARLLHGENAGITAIVQVPAALLVRPVQSRAASGGTTTTEAPPDREPDIPSPRDPSVTGGRPSGDPLTDEIPTFGPNASARPDEPIYQEICSAWFREHQAQDAGVVGDRSDTTDRDVVENPSEPSSSEETTELGGAPVRVAGDAPPWESIADDGWRAAAARSVDSSGEQTAVGLPRRRRGSALVPGAAGAGSDALPQPRRTIDAEALRDRMGSFQAGSHRGRRELDTDSFESPDSASLGLDDLGSDRVDPEADLGVPAVSGHREAGEPI